MKIKQPAKLKILRAFFKYSANRLPFGIGVANHLDPLLFPGLPVSPDKIKVLATTLKVKQAAKLMGGLAKTAARNTAFDALAAALDKDAKILEQVDGFDLEMLLKTGYLAASTNRRPSPLANTAIKGLWNHGTTQVRVQLVRVANTRTYHVQVSPDGGQIWLDAAYSSKGRRIVLVNLLPGTTYLVRARAIGGSPGASALWSDAKSIMST